LLIYIIIGDEAPMAHKFCFEPLDKSSRDIMSSLNHVQSPFGGKVVVFGGDFKQILPVKVHNPRPLSNKVEYSLG